MPHVTSGCGNIIRAYSFHLEWKPNLRLSKNRGNGFPCLFFSEHIILSIALSAAGLCEESLMALVWPHATIVWRDRLVIGDYVRDGGKRIEFGGWAVPWKKREKWVRVNKQKQKTCYGNVTTSKKRLLEEFQPKQVEWGEKRDVAQEFLWHSTTKRKRYKISNRSKRRPCRDIGFKTGHRQTSWLTHTSLIPSVPKQSAVNEI